jgi:hypothetical protein
VFLQSVIGAINAAAPVGFACSYADLDRIELARIDADGIEHRGADVRVPVPPSVSAVRERMS